MFLGYGLEEIEVLEYILQRGRVGEARRDDRVRRYILQGFFNAEITLFDLLQRYYLDSFNTELIGFPKDYKSYGHQIAIIADWSKKLRFGDVTLADEVAAMKEELRGG